MIEVVQAFDRKPIISLDEDDARSLETKLTLATRLFKDRRNWLPAYVREEVLLKLIELMQGEREVLALQISREGGKPLLDARVEVDRAIEGVRCGIDVLRTHVGREIPMGLSRASDRRHAWTLCEPIGVVAAVSAFNHPLNLATHQVIPAIAAGCPIIIKPAGPTPLSCLRLVALLEQAGLPPGWVQTLLTRDSSLAERMVTDPRTAFFSFIGSARVGWYLRSKLAPGTRCALEHGGVAPVVVDHTADIDSLIEPLAKGGYYHAGQVCVSVQRIYVDARIYDSFTDQYRARVEALRVGDPIAESTEVGPLIQPAEADRVKEWIDEAVTSGATLWGGERLSATTVAPAILLEPPQGSKVASEEVFGPATCVFRVESLADGIVRANTLPFAFHSAVFTRDLGHALEAAEQLDASAVMVNDHTAFRVDWMPFAGRHGSGYGVGGIPFTAHEMTVSKMIVFRF